MTPSGSSEGEGGFKYWAFISYSHRDEKWGKRLHVALESYRVPERLTGVAGRGEGLPKRLLPVFRDREELPVSADLGSNIRTALERARCIVVICSPDSAKSRWVNEEILAFKRLGRASHVLALIAGGEPNASDGKPGFAPESECFPPALRFSIDAEGALTSLPAEPIAADARTGKDGWDNSLLKLIAGILGVDYDALRQRERHRQRRRRIANALATLAVLGILAGFWLWQQQRTARRLQAEQEAGKRRLAAEQHAAERKRADLIALHAADEAEEKGRRAMLAGNAVDATAEFQKALIGVPDRPIVRLMLAIARRQSGGAVEVLAQGAYKVTAMDMNPAGDRLFVADAGDQVAALWDLKTKHRIWETAIPRILESVQVTRFSADGKKLFIKQEKGVGVYAVESGKEIAEPGGSGSSGCFLGDGARMLLYRSQGMGPTATTSFSIFDLATGKETPGPDLGPGLAGGVQSDLSGHTILAGWFTATAPPAGVKLWVGEPWLKWFDLESGHLFADLPRHESGVMELSPDGERLLYLRTDRAFEARSKTDVLWTSEKSRFIAPTAHWSRGGRYALLSAFGKTEVRDGQTGKVLWNGVFSDPATDASDRYLAHSDQGGTVHVYELATGNALAEFPDRIGWPDLAQFPRDRLASFTPDGRFLALAGSGHVVKVWDWRRVVAEPLALGGHADPELPVSAAFSADGALLGVRRSDASVTIWEVATGRLRATVETGKGEGGAWTLAFSPDGRRLLTGAQTPGELTAAELWDTASGVLLGEIDDGGKAVSAGGRGETRSPMLEQHIRVAWAGARFITVNFNLGLGCLWDSSANHKIADFRIGSNAMELSAPGEGPKRLAVSADGRRFVVAGFDGTARVFTTPAGELLSALPHPFPKLASAELSGDGAMALTWDNDSHIVIWDAARAREIVRLDTGATRFTEAHLSADARYVAAACADHSVRLWDARSGEARGVLKEEKPPGEGVTSLGAPIGLSALAGSLGATGFLSAQFDPHGAWISAIDDDGRLCVWELPSGRQALRWKLDPSSRTARLAVSPDGHRLAVLGVDGAVRLFNFTPEPPNSRSP